MLIVIRLIIVIAASLFFLSCSDNTKTIVPEEKQKQSIPDVFSKLLGTWKNTNTNQFEHWSQISDTTFTSVVFSINVMDTVRTEEAIIYPQHGKWIFENKVSNQNDGKSVQFISSMLTDTAIQFTNPAHDFPTDVHYTITGPASMRAFIIGPGKTGKKDTIYFNYRRVKD